tara:strand:+ start:363 stop:467 length:105 start_codon:yes stop_codon:yes gene_type:complete
MAKFKALKDIYGKGKCAGLKNPVIVIDVARNVIN